MGSELAFFFAFRNTNDTTNDTKNVQPTSNGFLFLSRLPRPNSASEKLAERRLHGWLKRFIVLSFYDLSRITEASSV